MASRYVPFFESFYNAVKDLSDERRLRIYDGLVAYGFTGEYPDFEGDAMLELAFKLMLPNVDTTMRRVEAGRANREGKTADSKKPAKGSGKR